jgi:hypothetical protein
VASISRHSRGVLEQLDRGGNPTINPFINPDGEKNLFNSRQPADDVANDVYSLRFAWLTSGKVTPAGLKPHDDLLAHFPYLGPPRPR